MRRRKRMNSFARVPRLAFADDAAGARVEGGEQRCRAMPYVVVRQGRGAAPLQRQARLCAVERLDLALFVDAEHQRTVGRVQVEADDVGDLLLEQ